MRLHEENRYQSAEVEKKAREILKTAKELTQVNPLLAANKIKSIAVGAAAVSVDIAEISNCSALLIMNLIDKVEMLEKELKNRGLISG